MATLADCITHGVGLRKGLLSPLPIGTLGVSTGRPDGQELHDQRTRSLKSPNSPISSHFRPAPLFTTSAIPLPIHTSRLAKHGSQVHTHHGLLRRRRRRRPRRPHRQARLRLRLGAGPLQDTPRPLEPRRRHCHSTSSPPDPSPTRYRLWLRASAGSTCWSTTPGWAMPCRLWIRISTERRRCMMSTSGYRSAWCRRLPTCLFPAVFPAVGGS